MKSVNESQVNYQQSAYLKKLNNDRKNSEKTIKLMKDIGERQKIASQRAVLANLDKIQKAQKYSKKVENFKEM